MFEHYPDYEYAFASTQLALAMLGMGATLAPQDFAQVLRTPRALTVGLAVQWLVVPLIAAAVARALGLEAGLAVGLVLVAAVPGGSMSNVAVYLADGNTSLSISLTVVATVACLLTAPLILRVFCGAYLPPGFSMPVDQVMFEIGLCLIAPLGVGMGVRRLLGPGRRTERFTRLCITLSLLVIAAMVIGSTGSGRIDAGAYGGVAVLGLALTALGFSAAGMLAARATGLTADDAVAVAVEVTIRNTNLALLLKASLFPAAAGVADPLGDQVFFISLLYGAMAVPLAIPMLVLHKRAKRAAPAASGA